MGAGYQEDKFTVHPFPIDQPKQLSNYLPPPTEISLYLTVYSDWSQQKADLLGQLGYQIKIFNKDPGVRRATGTELRNRLRAGADFTDLVSPGVATAIKQLGLDQKLARTGLGLD